MFFGEFNLCIIFSVLVDSLGDSKEQIMCCVDRAKSTEFAILEYLQ
jgi:hypothetical protein